jgi:hypothetical protein
MTQPSEITLDSVVVTAKEQVSSDLGDEIAILGLRRNTYYSVAAVGRRIWELVQTPRSVSEILAQLLSQYQVDGERCRGDLITMLGRLRDEGLLDVVDGAPR